MPHFRFHTLDASGKIIGVGQFECLNSEIALERVKQLAGDCYTELWQLVSSFETGTNPGSDGGPASTRTRKRLHS